MWAQDEVPVTVQVQAKAKVMTPVEALWGQYIGDRERTVATI